MALGSAHDHTRGVNEGSKVAVDWAIKNLDSLETIRPQLPMPEGGITFTHGGTLTDQQRFGEQDPVTHWVHGITNNVTFNAILFTRHAEEADAVKDLHEQIILLTQKDDLLGRPNICHFNFGSAFADTVLIEKVTSNIVSVDNEGRAREIRLSISLRKYVPFSQQQIDPTKPPKESFYLVATEVERSYEALARAHYGDPLLGDRIRKRHPAFPFAPSIGSVVKIPPKAVILREEINPSFHALSLSDEDAVDNFERILAARNARQLVTVV